MVRSLLGLFSAADVARAQAVLERVGLARASGTGASILCPGAAAEGGHRARSRAGAQGPPRRRAHGHALAHTVLALLRRISEEDGLTVVTSLHVLELARLYGRRVIGLRAGRLVYDGPPDGLTNAMAERIFASRAA